MQIVSFFYGWVGGIAAVVLCILYGFDVIVTVMRMLAKVLSLVPYVNHSYAYFLLSDDKVLHRIGTEAKQLSGLVSDNLQDLGLEGYLDSSESIPPTKLDSRCVMSYMMHGVPGVPTDGRLVLTGRTVSVYEVLTSHNRADEARAADNPLLTVEHLRGKIEVARVGRITVRQLRTKKKTQNGIFSGKVLTVTSADGSPLLAVHNNMHSPGGGSTFADNQSVLASVQESAMAAPTDDRHSAVSGSDEGSSAANPAGNPISRWTNAIFKFNNARDTERWHNVLRGIDEVEEWRRFVMEMPYPDTVNMFISRFLFQNMRHSGLTDAIKGAIRKKLRKVARLKFPRDLGGQIELDDFVAGKAIPFISGVSAPKVSTTGEIAFRFNLGYNGGQDGFVLYLRLALTYRGIRIPHVVLSLKLHELLATVHVSIGPPPSKKFWIGGCKPPVLRLELHQGGASGKGLLHRILTSLPDLSGIVANLIKIYFFSDLILPLLDDFPLPSVVKTPPPSPRSQKAKRTTFDRRRAAEISSAPELSETAVRRRTSNMSAAPTASNLEQLRADKSGPLSFAQREPASSRGGPLERPSLATPRPTNGSSSLANDGESPGDGSNVARNQSISTGVTPTQESFAASSSNVRSTPQRRFDEDETSALGSRCELTSRASKKRSRLKSLLKNRGTALNRGSVSRSKPPPGTPKDA